MHFSTLIAAFMLPLAVLGGPIARATDGDADRAHRTFSTGSLETIKLLEEVSIIASGIESKQAPLINGTRMVRNLVAAGGTAVQTGFLSNGKPHILPEEYVEAYSSLLVRVLTTVFVLPA